MEKIRLVFTNYPYLGKKHSDYLILCPTMNYLYRKNFMINSALLENLRLKYSKGYYYCKHCDLFLTDFKLVKTYPSPNFDNKHDYGSSKLYEYEYQGDMSGWSFTIGVDSKDMLIKKNKLEFYCGFDETVIIPEGIEIIDSYCFYDNDHIKKVILPKSIKTIKSNAFDCLSNLSEVRFNPKSKNVDINICAFSGCDNIKKISIPKCFINDKTIGSNLFEKSIYLLNNGNID